jgi:O-antigen/teichoic acid export membrane protein
MTLPDMRRTLRRFQRSQFISGVATLASGTMIAQILNVVATPILSRQFAPIDFAVFGVFSAMLAVLTAVGSFRFELGAVTARSAPSAASALALALAISGVFSALALVIGYFFGDVLAQTFKTPGLASWLWLLGPALLFTTWQHVMSFWVTRRGLFRNQAVAEVARSLGTVGSQMLFGLAGLAAGGLIWGRLIGLALASSVTGFVTLRPDRDVIRRGFNPRRLAYAASRFRNFLLFQTPKALVNVSTNQLPVMLLAASFGATVAGLYWFVERLLLIPVNVLSSAVQRLFLKTATDRYNLRRSFAVQWAKATAVLFALGACGLIVIAILGPAGFGFVFGRVWTDAWYFAVWISIWFACRLATGPSQSVYIVTDRQGTQFAIESSAAAVRLAIIPVGAYFFSANTVVAIYCLAGAALNLAVICVAGMLAFRHKHVLGIKGKGS